jgi:hypothetical protein
MVAIQRVFEHLAVQLPGFNSSNWCVCAYVRFFIFYLFIYLCFIPSDDVSLSSHLCIDRSAKIMGRYPNNCTCTLLKVVWECILHKVYENLVG